MISERWRASSEGRPTPFKKRQSPRKKRFLAADGSTEWTVPDGVTTIKIRIAGGNSGGSDFEPGEEGEYQEQTHTVTPGDVLTIKVGKGGNPDGTGVRGDDGFVEIEW
ncbi:hypothetical protein [Shinella sp.]|uniref:glycine-rich domain-containing protein n=1 Tax=Shinella sp. TaxID=1870904 RepID=UPI003F6EE9E8